jgi:predicted RNase H-like nuclease (RuvC/YqgF family)
MDEQSTVSQDGFQTVEEFNATEGNKQMTLFNLKELAVNNTWSLEKLQAEVKTVKKMYDEVFDGDVTYKEEKEWVEEQSKNLRQIKASIKDRPEMRNLEMKMKDLKRELKEKKSAVSDYALEVLRKTGNNEFEKDGEVFEISTVAKLIKRKQ